MKVYDFMTPEPLRLRSDQTLKDAAYLFYKYKIKGAPVVDETGKLCGLFTYTHLVKAIIYDMSFLKSVTTLMNQAVITVSPETDIEEAWHIPVSRLPVVNEEQQLIGILTRKDFLKAFHQQMRRITDEMRTVVGSAHSGIIVVNGQGIITTMNDAARKLLHISEQTVTGRDIEDFVIYPAIKKVLHTGQGEVGYDIKIEDNEIFANITPVKEGLKVVGAVAIIQDTSELQHIIRQYAATQYHLEQFESMFQNSQHGMIVVNQDNVVTLLNQAYANILGRTVESIVGKPIHEVIENSRLSIVMQTGVPEIYQCQIHQGRCFIVNRRPIFKDGAIIGAVGEVVFDNVNEVKELVRHIDRIEAQEKVLLQQHKAKEDGSNRYSFEDIIGRSIAMVKAKNLAAKACRSNSTVLITGESGVGKEVFAKAIHYGSSRQNGALVSVNCAAIPDNLLESELFGYEEGAFTGAKKGGKKGKFEMAHEGTLFLDEIGDMPLAMQAKLLRVLQDKQFEPVGSNQIRTCDMRLIAATNRNLIEMVKAGTFREDLYYRLNVIHIHLPPLRERKEDFGELLSILVRRIAKGLNRPIQEFTPEALTLLRQYSWPGNVRQLINCLEKLMVTVDDRMITHRHLSFLQEAGENMSIQGWDESDDPEQQKQIILEALCKANGNKTLAAQILGVHRSTLYNQMRRLKLK